MRTKLTILENLLENGVPPMYQFQTIWTEPRVVMIHPGNKRYWTRQLLNLLKERIVNVS